MYGRSESGADESERTAFRKAEKKYKLYYDDYNKRSKKKKHPRAVDLTEVIDFNSFLNSSLNPNANANANANAGVSLLNAPRLDRPVFCLDKRPGFYFIPAALTIEEQCQWIRESLTTFPQPPNRTNHYACFGPIHDLFLAAKQSKVFLQHHTPPLDDDAQLSQSTHAPLSCKSTPASDLLRKLRWTTLGLQFDWSKRSYNLALPHNKIPDLLCQLAKKMAAPAMPLNEEFNPEAAIVNYFGSGDMLGGHLDDMEADCSKPIVSLSLGCKAIFLLGGKSREDDPLAMFLRSGDVVLMAGEARECFHGVPRIFTDKDNADISHLELQLSHEDDLDYLEYVKSSRININIRQVF